MEAGSAGPALAAGPPAPSAVGDGPGGLGAPGEDATYPGGWSPSLWGLGAGGGPGLAALPRLGLLGRRAPRPREPVTEPQLTPSARWRAVGGHLPCLASRGQGSWGVWVGPAGDRAGEGKQQTSRLWSCLTPGLCSGPRPLPGPGRGLAQQGPCVSRAGAGSPGAGGGGLPLFLDPGSAGLCLLLRAGPACPTMLGLPALPSREAPPCCPVPGPRGSRPGGPAPAAAPPGGGGGT